MTAGPEAFRGGGRYTWLGKSLALPGTRLADDSRSTPCRGTIDGETSLIPAPITEHGMCERETSAGELCKTDSAYPDRATDRRHRRGSDSGSEPASQISRRPLYPDGRHDRGQCLAAETNPTAGLYQRRVSERRPILRTLVGFNGCTGHRRKGDGGPMARRTDLFLI